MRARPAVSPSPERAVTSTADFDDAVAAMRAAFGDVELDRGESGEARLTMRSVRLPDVAATRWAMSGVGSGRGSRDRSPDEQTALTGVLLGGDATLTSRRAEIDVGRPFLYPEAFESRLGRPDVANLAISMGALRTRASAMTGGVGPELRFTGTAPLDPGLDRLWRDTMVYVTRTLEALVDLPDAALAQTSLVDHVALLMLHTFPNTALDAEDRQRTGAAQLPTLRRTLQFIDDNLDVPFTVPELAAAARLSLRGLHLMFRRELDTTPMAYVRRARLAAARAELVQGDPTTTDVPSVARRWGFPRVEEFGRRYRAAFGEATSETLRGSSAEGPGRLTPPGTRRR